MKKVIDGKLYNTETAELLHEWDNGCYGNDFNECSESLYRTKKGVFFIAGSGGAMSKYAESCGQNSVCGGEGIEPLTSAAAREWAETHDMDADEMAKVWAIEEA